MADEYIRREDALAAVDERIITLAKDAAFVRKRGDIDLHGIKPILASIPAADVRTVVRGIWLTKEYD